MKNHGWQRIAAFVLVLAMVLTMAPALGTTGFARQTSEFETIGEVLDSGRFQLQGYDQEEAVTFLVELEDQPLLDQVPENQTLTQFLQTRTGSARVNSLERHQSVMADRLETCSDDSVSITHTYRYVLNGFAVQAAYGARAELEALEGVKRVSVARTYSVPTVRQADGGVITSGSMLNSDAANAEGYTGKGTVVAILDTGLDVNHPAFSADPQSPAFSKDTVATAVRGGELQTDAGADQLYKSLKIPFAYDYADKDADVADPQDHGTHVAGTVGANSDGFYGVAPDAQLVIMKVFSDVTPGAGEADILAALEDCVILGVDAINMSLGTPCGFTTDLDSINQVYERVKAAGINLMAAAGNDESAAYNNLLGTDLALVGNPDYGIVGSPSTYGAALSVASVNEMSAVQNAFLLGEQKIFYTDTAESEDMKFYSLEGEQEFVHVTGVGNANDFAKVDVTGKIALVERGEIAFTEKETNAKNAGAVGLIVYDNVEGERINMQLGGLLPAAFISKADGKLLRDAAHKTLQISKEYCGPQPSPVGGQMSDFSSIGVAPDMSLKPEITAPGGNVWSTLPGGSYGEMSGTSMASPHMAGAAAIVQQYADTAFSHKTEQEKQSLINALLMSTAVPVQDPDGVAYSPRKQGAGLANVYGAIHAGAYLTVEGAQRPKAELGDDPNGAFTFTFTVENFSDTQKTYTVDAIPLVAKVETVNGYDCISDYSRILGSDEFTVTFSQETLTVAPGGSASVTVTMALTESGKTALSVFPNGIFLEGFVTLTAAPGGVDLSLPYLGYFGDWGKAPIFDASRYENNGADAFMAGSTIAMIDQNGNGNYLGVNAITGEYDPDKIAYAHRTAGYYLITPMLGLLRAPQSMTYTAAPAADPANPVYTVEQQNVMKSFYYASGGFIYTSFLNWADSWQPIGYTEDGQGAYYLDDGPYTYTITGAVAGTQTTQSQSYTIHLDNQGPSLVSTTYAVEDGTPYLYARVTDNHYVMAAQLVNEAGTAALSPIVAVDEDAQGAVTELKFDLTQAQDQGQKLCRLSIYDYAWNETMTDVISTVSQDIEVFQVLINSYAITARTDSGNMEVDAFVDPDNAVDKTLTWSSTDEDVMKVISVSEDTHTATISFEGPGKCQLVATASNGVFGTADVTVSAVYAPWPHDNTIREDGIYQIPANLNTTVTITDNAHDVHLVGSGENTADAPYSNLSIHSLNDNLNLTIQDLHTVNSGWSGNSALIFTGAGNTLKLRGANSLTADDYCSKAMVSVASGVELAIAGTGALTLKSEAYCDGAGIGGDAGQGSGKITIDGGNFVIHTTGGGAAIGAGANNGATDITINDGTFDIAMPLVTGWPSNLSLSGAAIGGGYYAMSGTTKITINGGAFQGYTQVDAAIIGTAHNSSKPASLLVEINGGKFDLLTEDVYDTSMTGGACIGTSTPSGSSYMDADITINGGEIIATSKSNAAAIGGGPGAPTGNIYINGGTVTAVSTFEADAMGKGSLGPEGNIRISGGSVKAVSTGTGAAFGDATLVNADSDPVYLVNISAPDVKNVTVNGVDWKVFVNHPEDDLLYLWLPASDDSYAVVVDNGETTQTVVVYVGQDGTVQIQKNHSVTYALTNLTVEGPSLVHDGETLTATLTPDAGWLLPETVSVTMAGQLVQAAYSQGVVTLENVTGPVVITASAFQPADKRELEALLDQDLEEADYTPETWAGYEAALEKARAVAQDPYASQEEVDQAVKALEEALESLVRVEVHVHAWSEWTVTEEATCTQAGLQTRSCACGQTEEQVIPALGHEFTSVVTEPTCVSYGFTTHTCGRCAHSYVNSMTEPLGHSYVTHVTEPTCTAAGYTTHTCTACGHIYVDTPVEALGHDYRSVVTAPTHEAMGYTTHTCAACGHSFVDSYTDALGHAYTAAVTTEPTCTTPGLMTFTCDCGESYTEPIPMVAHSYTAVVKAPTCTSMGYTTYTCACGHSYVSDLVDSLEHAYSYRQVEATCHSGGYTVATCDHCGFSFVEDVTEALDHVWSDWTVTVDATCFADGLQTRTCQACGETEEQTIAANSDHCPARAFADLDPTRWYHQGVDYVLENGIMKGMSETTFAPNGKLTRAQLVTILYRLEGEPAVEGEVPFTDAEDRFYTDALLWAYQNEIVKGMTETTFAPNANVTREQMVTFLARYAESKGIDISAQVDLTEFDDKDKVSKFAKESMAWAVAQGLVEGMDGVLNPKGIATRAQFATIVMRYRTGF